MAKKNEQPAKPLPRNYKISEGQIANPEYGQPGHENTPAIAAPKGKAADEDQQPPA